MEGTHERFTTDTQTHAVKKSSEFGRQQGEEERATKRKGEIKTAKMNLIVVFCC